MATRRAIWSGPRLHCRPSQLQSSSHHDGTSSHIPINHQHPKQPTPRLRQHQRRWLASHAPLPGRFNDFMPAPPERSELDVLLEAIQGRDTPQISQAFLAWTAVLADPDSPYNAIAVAQLLELPGPTFSEILRSIDPLVNTGHDVAYGLNLTQGLLQFTDTGKLVDSLGVRDIYRRILDGVNVLVELRGPSARGMAASDYEAAMRVAGAAVDFQGIKLIWTAMAANRAEKSRTVKTWTEFVKARFMIDPVYYQFDRSRVANLARDLYSNHSTLKMKTINRLEGLRMSLNAFKMEPWNRRIDQHEEDMRRLLRRRLDYRAYKGHWIRALYFGLEIDRELLYTSIIAFSRSSSLHTIKKIILENYYGIKIENAHIPADIKVSGGRNFRADSPIRPDVGLLDAIVEAFGSMSHIALAVRLIQFISQRYSIPIPHSTWSNLLNWTYVCAAKPFAPMRKIHGDYLSTRITSADVRQLWNTMTSEPFNVTPTFDDLDAYIKTLILHRSYDNAVQLIQQHAIPHYNALTRAYHNAILNEVLQNDASFPSPSSSPSSRATHARKQLEVRKDHVRHQISNHFLKILRTISSSPSHQRTLSAASSTLIPDLILQHPEFFHHEVQYRTPQGHVTLTMPTNAPDQEQQQLEQEQGYEQGQEQGQEQDNAHYLPPRFRWTRSWRLTLPAKRGGHVARLYQDSDNPDFPYPFAPVMRVHEWRRRPKARPGTFGAPPPATGDGEAGSRDWWNGLEEQLML